MGRPAAWKACLGGRGAWKGWGPGGAVDRTRRGGGQERVGCTCRWPTPAGGPFVHLYELCPAAASRRARVRLHDIKT